MKNVLILYAHWHPVNLAGIHRPRLIGNFLTELGWKPIVLTVNEKYFEEEFDPDFDKTFSEDIATIRVNAFPIIRPRFIGDIGLRAFFQMYRKALQILKTDRIDFIWIPIPSFYTALIGRLLYRKTKIPYGIDYIDPWVRDISTRKDWRHRLSNLAAKVLEPFAVKKASLITGVSYEYYKPVLERNFKSHQVISCMDLPEPDVKVTNNQLVYHAAFPYGFDPMDHKIKLNNIKYPWSRKVEMGNPWIYAGAFLPTSRLFVELLFKTIAELRKSETWNNGVKLYFIGTGSYPGKSIIEYAEEAGIADIVWEDRSRYPFLHILNFLSQTDTVMILGSTEKHYTASKVFQALLSERPVWAIFHEESSAIRVMEESKADQFLVKYKEGLTEVELKLEIKSKLLSRLNNNDWQPDLRALVKYSARESARKLVEGMELVLSHADISPTAGRFSMTIN